MHSHTGRGREPMKSVSSLHANWGRHCYTPTHSVGMGILTLSFDWYLFQYDSRYLLEFVMFCIFFKGGIWNCGVILRSPCYPIGSNLRRRSATKEYAPGFRRGSISGSRSICEA